MENIKNLKPLLPLTFQNILIKSYPKTNCKTISVKKIHSKAVTTYDFYRPISKTMKIVQ